jgi:hypothetical protein
MLTVGLGILLVVGVVLFTALGPADSAVAQEEVEIPFLEEWQESGHADADAEAFVHWDEDDPQVVEVACAQCHSTPGYRDYLGVDGSAEGSVEEAPPVGTTVECIACHNDVTLTKTSVVMPSGVELTGLGDEARCMVCHQGRHSTVSVNNAIEEAGVADVDTVSEDLGFVNIHYYAAAATKYGTLAQGGFQYDGKSYDGNFEHVEEFNTCIECHDPHTLEIQVEQCTECHTDVADVEDLKDLRLQGSLVDYDGDGDLEEGVFYETQGLQEMLYQAIQAYAEEVAGTPIVYDSASYPYFFIDTNADGEVSEDEAAFPNQYNAWTPRLVKAAYNYQVSLKDPGEFAHGGKYVIQLLYDSIEDLNQAIADPVSLEEAHRNDHGHFAGSEEAFRHWDEDDPQEVPASCSKCHSAQGLPIFLQNDATIAQPVANGFQCSTCHNDLQEFTTYEVAEVEFPSGAVVSSEDPQANLCMQCHQGRSSTQTVQNAVEGLEPDEVAEDLGFVNIHYFAAGATLFGSEVHGAYEFEGQEYAGQFEHIGDFDSCTECHSTHRLQVRADECGACHGVSGMEELDMIRESSTDFDGDGDTDEGIAGEIQTMQETLYAALQDYAANTVGTPIVYDSHSYPYFFTDSNGNGEPDPDEAAYDNRYASWTPTLLKAAYNYQYAEKDPGAFAHNAPYVLQALYDSIEAVGGDTSGMTRP